MTSVVIGSDGFAGAPRELRGAVAGPENALHLVDQLLSVSPDDAQLRFAEDQVFPLLQRYGDHPSGFLAYNDKVDHFTDPARPGVVSYRRS